MKKILTLALLMASSIAFAEGSHPQQSPSTASSTASTSSSAVSSAQGGQQQQGIQQAGNSQVTVGCLVNCAATDTASRDLTDLAIANINAEAAKEIADKNAAAARAVAGTTQTIRNTPSVSGPALTTSNDTCMGSSSGSLNIAGLGLGGGTSWVDANCKMLKNSRELWNMGMKAASLALMCTDSANREALEITGFVCPQTAAANQKAAASTGPVPVAQAAQSTTVASSGGYQGNDPIIRARLGLK